MGTPGGIRGTATPPGTPGTPDRAGRRGAAAAFVRFVICGGGVSLLSSGVLLALDGRVMFAAANAAVTVASTLLATELHHRFTFGTGKGPAGWRVHAQSALTLALAYLVTTTAVLTFAALHPHPSPLLTQAVYLTASGLTGIARFLTLRLFVFAHRAGRPAASALHRSTVTTAA